MNDRSLDGRFLLEWLADSGMSLPGLGIAYAVLLLTTIATVAIFALIRMHLVITPNRAAGDYGLYALTVIIALATAVTLENRIVTWRPQVIGYEVFPQLILLGVIHFWIHRDGQPWLIALGASALAATLLVGIPAASLGNGLGLAHWTAAGLLAALLGLLAKTSISTKRGFIRARSIHVESHETERPVIRTQRPWLGLPQWVALGIATFALAMTNAVLGGNGLTQVPALPVLLQSLVILAITGSVASIPAGTYWLAHRHWMPELTRFVWLVWLVVGFAFSYGNILAGLDQF